MRLVSRCSSRLAAHSTASCMCTRAVGSSIKTRRNPIADYFSMCAAMANMIPGALALFCCVLLQLTAAHADDTSSFGTKVRSQGSVQTIFSALHASM